jgi:hypothetical protein
MDLGADRMNRAGRKTGNALWLTKSDKCDHTKKICDHKLRNPHNFVKTALPKDEGFVDG